MPRKPAARASAARDNVAFTEVYRPGSLERIRAGIPVASLEAIDKTAGASWLGVEHDHYLMDGTIAQLGVRDAVDCWRQSVAQLIDKPLLKSFVQGGMRLFGAKPGALLKLVPKGWSLAYRDFCVPRFERCGDREARLAFEEICDEAFVSPGYLHCWHGICFGVFDLEKPSNPRIEFEIDERSRRAVAHFTWD
jgi:hypothetical protein